MQIGILQGRLSPSPSGSLQNYPANWQAEFAIAHDLGFDALEILLQKDNYGNNPLLSDHGISKINELKQEHQIKTPSICCDNFMAEFLFGNSGKNNTEFLLKLLTQAKKINASRLILPFLEDSDLDEEIKKQEVIENLNLVSDQINQIGIELVFETALKAPELKSFLNQFNTSLVKVCYDTGNTTSFWGELVAQDIVHLEKYIASIHIKDRKHGSTTSYPLGTGGTNFENIFKSLKQIDYQGPFIIEAARVADRDEVEMAKEYLKFTKDLINKYLISN